MGTRWGLASLDGRRNGRRIFRLFRPRPARLLCWSHRLWCAKAFPAIRSGHRRRTEEKRLIGNPVDRCDNPANLRAPVAPIAARRIKSGELQSSLVLKRSCKEIEANAIAPRRSKWVGQRLIILP